MREQTARRTIRIASSAAEIIILLMVLFLFVVGVYAIWDSIDAIGESMPEQYEIYKPDPWDGPTYPDLKAVNPDVIGWITLYGTNIDYPLVQGPDNHKYLKTAADGTYSLGGAIFLDADNAPDLSDFNSVIYGHSMSYNAMFGDIGDFLDGDYFAEHVTGDIYVEDKHYGLRVLAILEADAYKSGLYKIPVTEFADKAAYIDEITETAVHVSGDPGPSNIIWDDFYTGVKTGKGVTIGQIGDVTVGEDDRLAVLSTCTFRMTNGRHILVCRIDDETYEDPYNADPPRRRRRNFDAVGPGGVDKRLLWAIVLVIIGLVAAVYITGRANRKKKS